MSGTQSLQLFVNTVMRRGEPMSCDVVLQLEIVSDCCSYFSMQLDKPTNMVDTAHLAIFV